MIRATREIRELLDPEVIEARCNLISRPFEIERVTLGERGDPDLMLLFVMAPTQRNQRTAA